MGIEKLTRGKPKRKERKQLTTPNSQYRTLVQLYTQLAYRGDMNVDKTILRRLKHSRVNRYPISLSKIHKISKKKKKDNEIYVVVAKVLNDERDLQLPKLNICALSFTRQARLRVKQSGGQCFTLDQLPKIDPERKSVVLLRGRKSREALKHFGPDVGAKGSHTKPYVLNSNHRARERTYGHRKK